MMVCLRFVSHPVASYVVITGYPSGDMDLAHFLITDFGSYDEALVVYCYFFTILFERVLKEVVRVSAPAKTLPLNWRTRMDNDGTKRQSLYKEVVMATEQVRRCSLS